MEVAKLRLRGVDVDFLHDEGERRLWGQFSADVVVALGIFVAQTLAEHEILAIYARLKDRAAAALAMLKERGRDDPAVVLSVDVLRARKTERGFEIVAKRVRGPAEQTVELVREGPTRT
jgi:hypothetical protein